MANILVVDDENAMLQLIMHTAAASGSWRGAERQRCGASGSSLI